MPPNNKKKRKNAKGNKKKKIIDSAADGTSAASPLSRRSVRRLVGCPHNPASCDKCIYAFPRGCLHTLRETERDSPEFYEILRIYKDSFSCSKNLYWIFEDNKEVPCVVKKRMVRFLSYMAIKMIVGKNSFKDLSEDYRKQARTNFLTLLNVYGINKCGSIAAAAEALEAEDVALLRNESQVSYRALAFALDDLAAQGYHGLVYALHVLSPCDCLKTEVERVTNESFQNGECEPNLLECSSRCGNKEQLHGERCGCCPKCKMAVYCSRGCQKDHWKGHAATEQPHKVACQAIQELVAFLADDGRSCGDTTPGNNE